MADAEEVKPVAKKAAKKPAGKKPAGKQSEQPPNKKQKAEAKGWMAGPRRWCDRGCAIEHRPPCMVAAAEPEEEEQAGVSLKGTFIRDREPPSPEPSAHPPPAVTPPAASAAAPPAAARGHPSLTVRARTCPQFARCSTGLATKQTPLRRPPSW